MLFWITKMYLLACNYNLSAIIKSKREFITPFLKISFFPKENSVFWVENTISYSFFIKVNQFCGLDDVWYYSILIFYLKIFLLNKQRFFFKNGRITKVSKLMKTIRPVLEIIYWIFFDNYFDKEQQLET